MMKQLKPLPSHCARCGATADNISYHSRYLTQEGIRFVWRCYACHRTFCDRYGTAFYDLKTPEDKVQRAVQQVMEGLGYEAVARIEGVHPTTVQRWVERAQPQADKADREIIQQVSTEAVEMDELWSFAGNKQQNPDHQQDAVGKQWVHCALARQSRLLLEVVVGPRTLDTATALVNGTAQRLVPGCWPLWCSDGWENYLQALLSIFHVVVYFLRSGRRGRPRKPRLVPHPGLQYGQVVKRRVGHRVVSVTRRLVFGITELIPLAKISTSLLERLNGTMRLHVSPLRRKTRAFAKQRDALNIHVQLFKSYYNLCLVHSGLDGHTPAQAAGLTDHRWTVRELLTYGAPITSKFP